MLPRCVYGAPDDPCMAPASVRWGGRNLCALDAMLTIGDDAVDAGGYRAETPGGHVFTERERYERAVLTLGMWW